MAVMEIIKEQKFKDGIDLAGLVAKRARSLLWGKGLEVKALSKNHNSATLKLLEEFVNDNNIIGILAEVEKSLSINGQQAVGLDYDGANNVRITLFDMSSSTFFTDIRGKIITAYTKRRLIWGKGQFEITEYWGNTGVKRTVYDMTKNAAIPIPSFNRDKAFEFQTAEEWNYSNLGEIPIVLFQNINSTGNKSEADGENVKVIQTLLDHMLLTMYKDTEMSRTRYGFSQDDEALNKQIDKIGLYETIKDSTYVFGTENDIAKIQVLTSDYKGSTYADLIDFLKDKYFEGCGYSKISDSDGGSTIVGTLFTQKKDMETTREKYTIRKTQTKKFTDLLVALLNLVGDFIIKPKPNLMYDEQYKISYLEKGVELGVLTKRDVVKSFLNLETDDEVDEQMKLLEEEEKENMKKMEMMAALQNNDNNDNDDNDDDNDDTGDDDDSEKPDKVDSMDKNKK